MRDSFHQQLQDLQADIVRMGHLVAEAIDSATLSLTRQDSDLARQVIASDDEIDRLLIDIQVRSLKLTALQQPMARDLRTIGTGLKIVTDLERMADHAVDIAEAALRLAGDPLIKPLVDIPRMATLAREMIGEAMEAYVAQDEPLARRMIEKDHEVDRLYRLIFDELMQSMQENPSMVRQCTYLLHVAHYLERVGDHATNLGEWTIYRVTGELKELNT